MDTLDAIRSRRAVRGYDSQYVLSDSDRQELLELALLAPTAFNLQHVRLVDIQDPQLRAQIRTVAWDQAQVSEASMLVVICARVDSWQCNASRVWEGAPEDVAQFMVGAIDGYYRDKPQVQRDEALRSCGLVAQTLMLAARGKDLDSVPMDGFDFEAVGRLINLPENHLIGLMVAIGKRNVEHKPRVGRLPFDEVVRRDRF